MIEIFYRLVILQMARVPTDRDNGPHKLLSVITYLILKDSWNRPALKEAKAPNLQKMQLYSTLCSSKGLTVKFAFILFLQTFLNSSM